MNQEEEIKKALLFALKRDFAVLSRNLCGILEGLKKNHQINFNKLYDNLPPELENVISMADYFDNNHYEFYRKLILDATNQTKRNLKYTIDPEQVYNID